MASLNIAGANKTGKPKRFFKRSQLIMKIRNIANLLILFVGIVYGVDGVHRGFLYGIDLGTGLQTNFTQTIIGGHTYTGNLLADFSVPIDLKIGFSKKGNAGFFISSHNDWKKPGLTIMSANSVLLEIDQFMKPTEPSFFVCYGTGWELWLYPFDDYSNKEFSANGPTFFVGLAYEFGKNLVAKIDLSAGSLKHDGTITEQTIGPYGTILSSNQISYSQWFYMFSLRLTVGYLGYK